MADTVEQAAEKVSFGQFRWWSSTRRWAERSQLLLFGLFIFMDFVVGLASGVYYVAAFYETGECCTFHLRGWLVYGAINAVGMFTSVAALMVSGVSFGWPDLGPGHRVAQVLSSLSSLALTIVVGVVPLVWFPKQVDLGLMFAAIWTLFTGSLGIRGWPLVTSTPLMMVLGVLTPRVTWFRMVLILVVAANTRYLRDQRLVIAILSQPAFTDSLGAMAQKAYIGNAHWAFPVACAVGGLILPYVNLLMRRRLRFLPPGLRKVRFVRLGYLRRLFARRGRICRCQDLPEDAFGDPGKAMHLAILSHRWLNKHTCDVPTDEEPCGLKLEKLLGRLGRHFMPSCRNCVFGPVSRWHAATCIGGWDVLVFWDYISVPQNGLDDSGKVVPRTQEELAVFKECLPHMGVLYSLFPVLALTDVPRGDTCHEYFGSGWCLCEFSIAMLGQQLQLHSAQLVSLQHAMATCSGMKMSAEAAQAFRQKVHDELAAMHFEYQSDRLVAQDVLEGFLVKRMLLDLTRCGDTKEVTRIMDQLPGEQQLRAVLEQPVDAELNTLLHVAVKARQPDAAYLFLSRGASLTARNLRGDTPAQCFALPRVGRAAAMCRAWQGPAGAVHGNKEGQALDDEPEVAEATHDHLQPQETRTISACAWDPREIMSI